MGLLPVSGTPGPVPQLLKDFEPLPLQVWALQQKVHSANRSPLLHKAWECFVTSMTLIYFEILTQHVFGHEMWPLKNFSIAILKKHHLF